MASINIRRDVDDKFYRYKMPKLIAKVEGKGNGIKTVVPNMSAISLALTRPPAYAAKFFGFELGALTFTDAKVDRYGVNGSHTAEKLQSLLDVFITKFVLCADCKNPETDLVIKKNSDIFRDCKACGSSTRVDLRHKLSTFIIKNPPPSSHADKYKRKLKTKKTDDDDDSQPGTTGISTPGAAGSDHDIDDLTRKIQDEALLMKNIQLSQFEEDDWAEDMSSAAVAARQSQLASGVIKQVASGGGDEEDDPSEIFADFLGTDATDELIYQEAQRLQIRNDKALVIMVQVLFDESIDTEMINSRADLLLLFLSDEAAQKGLLGGLERLVSDSPTVMNQVPILLKAFYDADLVEEEVFLAWGAKASKRYAEKKVAKEIRAKASPFLRWLQEADDGDSEDEA